MFEISNKDELNSNELNEKKLYHPGVIVAYTILANAPLGLILYGINIINRGYKTYGKIILWSGIICGIALAAIIIYGLPSRGIFLIGIMCGITIYKFEVGPYKRAIASGAQKARWWPPLLIVAAITIALYIYLLLFSS